MPLPAAPTMIVLDKRTGRPVAKDDGLISSRVFHGQWSSPSLGTMKGRTLLFYGAGDGWCYAFDALRAASDGMATLKQVWSFDCNPPRFRYGNGRPITYDEGDCRVNPENTDDGTFYAPCEIIGTPAFHNDRVYVAIGRDPLHGRGRGILHCIDASKTGDVTRSAKIWSYEGIDRSLSTVAIADGLLFVADFPGRLHCLDAETGQCYWVHETGNDVWSSPLAADDKVYLGTRKSLWVLAVAKEKKIISEIRLGSQIRSAPVAANGVLYVASQRYLWAVRDQGAVPAPAAATASLPARRD
jgi:outer membrane protein assembly factor BamB